MFHLTIGIDPTLWEVPEDLDVVAPQLAQSTGPVVLPVTFPLQGNLVLSVRSAGAVWMGVPGDEGSHPSGAKLPGPLIRVPSAVAATPEAPGGYPLPPEPGLPSLQQLIEAAMSDGTLLTVHTSSVPSADLVLSGASLAYVVLCPQS